MITSFCFKTAQLMLDTGASVASVASAFNVKMSYVSGLKRAGKLTYQRAKGRRLDDSTITEIQKLLDTNTSISEISRKYKVSTSYISKLRTLGRITYTRKKGRFMAQDKIAQIQQLLDTSPDTKSVEKQLNLCRGYLSYLKRQGKISYTRKRTVKVNH